MERWLAPSNFDQDGTAKTSLAALMEERGSEPSGVMSAKQGNVRYWHLADNACALDMSAFDPKRTMEPIGQCY